MPYEDLCLLCDIDYDFIGHLETISEECQYILEKAGISNLTFCPDRRESSTDAEIKTFYAQIPRDTILKIRKIYGNDFEMHGYPFPGKLESRVEQFTWNEVWEQEIPWPEELELECVCVCGRGGGGGGGGGRRAGKKGGKKGG